MSVLWLTCPLPMRSAIGSGEAPQHTREAYAAPYLCPAGHGRLNQYACALECVFFLSGQSCLLLFLMNPSRLFALPAASSVPRYTYFHLQHIGFIHCAHMIGSLISPSRTSDPLTPICPFFFIACAQTRTTPNTPLQLPSLNNLQTHLLRLDALCPSD